MATQQQIQPYYAGSVLHRERNFKGGPEYPHWKETASQSFGVGDLLYIDTNGTIAIATVNGSSQSNGFLAGQAKKAATGTTGASVHMYALRPDEEFYMNVYHATPASAVTAQTQLGTVRGIVKISGKWYVDIQNAVEGAGDSLARVMITDFPQRHPMGGITNAIGDQYGLVIVQFLPLSIASDAAAIKRILQLSQ